MITVEFLKDKLKKDCSRKPKYCTIKNRCIRKLANSNCGTCSRHVLCSFSDYYILLNKHDELSNVIGLANYGDKIYWTDLVDGSIKYVDKSPLCTGHDIIRKRENVRGLTIYHEDRPTSSK